MSIKIIKDISIFTSFNIFKLIISLIITVPLTTYYLNIDDLCKIVFFITLSTLLFQPINCGGNSIINAYYFSKSKTFFSRFLLYFYWTSFFLKLIVLAIICIVLKALDPSSLLIDYNNILLIFLSQIFASTRSVAYHLFTIESEVKKYSYYTIFEAVVVNASIYYFLRIENSIAYYIYALLLSSTLIFLKELLLISSKMSFSFDKRYFSIIYNKGLRLYPYEMFLILSQRIDYLLVSKYVSLSSLVILQHAKTYPEKIEVLMKSYFQSLNVQFMKYLDSLNAKAFKNVIRFESLWYFILLVIGILIILFIETVIDILTHGKLNESAIIVSILYVSLFFKSKQQFFISVLLYNKKIELFTKTSSALSFFYLALLLIYHCIFGVNLKVIIFLILLFSLLKWIVLKYLSSKYYSFHQYKVYPFYLSLTSYLVVLFFYHWNTFNFTKWLS